MNAYDSVVSGQQFPRTATHWKNIRMLAGAQIPLLLLLFALFIYPVRLCASEVDRVEAGEVSAYGGEARIKHFVPTSGSQTQIGAKVYVGDEIETGSDGTLEVLFGLNVRMRLAGNTAIRISSRKVTLVETVVPSKQTTLLSVLLLRGELRTRVRENLVTPTPVQIVAANMQLLLPRSDCLVRRTGTGPENNRSISLLLGWGRCVLSVKAVDEKDWVADDGVSLIANGTAEVPEFPVGAFTPHWQQIKNEEAQKVLQLLPFSIDEQPRAPGEVPKPNPELDGA